jgi:acetolactate synthase-1/2/3 large subunit
MSQDTEQEVGERLVERLGEHGVKYIFATFGTDHPTLIKGLADEDTPMPILAPHEMTAASAAHGYAQATGDPGVVLVHVDVGTANLGASLHNAARSRIPLFIMAGRTPLTTSGDTPGSRSTFVHWYQDIADQHGIVREYTKWEDELEVADNVEGVIDRGLDIVLSDPAGPAYLTLPREILRQNVPQTEPHRPTSTKPATLDAQTRQTLVERLREADHPLVITTYLGREETAVPILESFAETVGIPVVETAPAFDLNFPRDHPLHYGFAAEPYFDEADLLLVVNCDVPWVPKRASPRTDATVVHIDADPAKSMYPMWDFPVDLRVRADAKSALADLTESFDAADSTSRGDRFREHGIALHEEWRDSVPDPADADTITPDLLSRTLGDVLGEDAIVVDETVTNTTSVLRHCTRTQPGTYYSYCSSGLGWGLGAAVGIALARLDKTVVGVIGDGSFVLGNPLAAIQMVQAYDQPHLCIIYNNAGWRAVSDAIADQYNEVEFDPTAFTRFDTGTDYAGLAEGWNCHGERVSEPAELRNAIERALTVVEDGMHAILDVEVS